MNNTEYMTKCQKMLADLKTVIESVDERLIRKTPDALIEQNINFLVKSFLIMMCVYIETYLKDVFMFYANDIDKKLSTINVPHALVEWSINKGKKFEEEHTTVPFQVNILSNDLDLYISPHPGRLTKLLLLFGIDISQTGDFKIIRENLMNIVAKRNNIVHHNDDASDVSTRDLVGYIDIISKYIQIIDTEIHKRLSC